MKNKIFIIVFIVYIFGFGLYSIVDKDKDISYTERRYLDTIPKFELSNKYIDKLDRYLVDHFPLRDEYRSVKALYNYNVLNMLVNNNIYIDDNYIFKSNYPTSISSVKNFIKHINETVNLMNDDNNIYLMVVPDKNYYLNSDDFLHIEYDYIYDEVSKIDNINFIDIRDVMELKDYYETDTHWKQENLSKVVKLLVEQFGYKFKDIKYNVKEYDKFYGVYYGESAVDRGPEILKYLTSDVIESTRVEYLENLDFNKVYNEDKLDGMDSYDVYLDGASSYIEIYNENSSSGKELIIFRDSFGSSISPLLIDYYSKITVIDNRYIHSSMYMDKVKFKDQDVLFLYSTLLINESFTLKN